MTRNKPDKNKWPANLCKRGNSWILDFIYRGQRYTENLGPVSKTVAKERAVSRKVEVAEGRRLVDGKRWDGIQWIADNQNTIGDPAFTDAMKQYLEFYKAENAPYTYQKYALPASKNLQAYFGRYRLSQISLLLIEKYKRDRKASGKADGTVNRELTLLRHFFNKCIDFQLARSNPFRVVLSLENGTHRVQKVRLYKEHGRERYITEEESGRLLSACNADLRLVVLTAMHTGFRSSELKSLQWSDIDLVNGTATVRSRYSKNGDPRHVPLTDDLARGFRRLKEARNPSQSDYVFILNGQRWKCWKEAFRGAVERAGLTDLRFHDLRHVFGSNLGMANTNQKAMMELMGHRDPKMTLRYTHLSVDYKRQAVAKLPSFGAGIMDSHSKFHSSRIARKW